MDKNLFGLAVGRCRNEKGYTQKELANAVGCTSGMIAQIETGRKMPGVDLQVRIMSALGMDFQGVLRESSVQEIGEDEKNILDFTTRLFDFLAENMPAEKVVEALSMMENSFEAFEAAARYESDNPVRFAPEGWTELSQKDRKLVQRLVDRLIEKGK